MIEMKHTPGPWFVEFEAAHTKSQHKITAPTQHARRSFTVAMLVHHNESQEDAAVSLADARLIAAAPDLLEDLRSAIELIDAIGAEEPLHPHEIEWMTKANSTIAKTTGL